MTGILIDTNIYSYAIKGEPDAVAILKEYDRLLFSPIVIGELLAGFKGGSREKTNETELRDFLSEKMVQVVSVTENTALFYSAILDNLKRQGTPLPTNDIWIAASAMENGAALATRDGHFQKIPGLLLVS